MKCGKKKKVFFYFSEDAQMGTLCVFELLQRSGGEGNRDTKHIGNDGDETL